MKVFISWSGERSRVVAETLREWLPRVIQAVDPWVSLNDIDKGARWLTEVTVKLEECQVGLICLTPENLLSPWLLFEAGALSKRLDKSFVCPYLLGLKDSDVQQPLSQFQLTRAEKEETRKLLHTINKALEERALQSAQLDIIFDKWWPDLDDQLKSFPPMQAPSAHRPDRDLLEEILEGIRSLLRQPPAQEARMSEKLIAASLAELLRTEPRRVPQKPIQARRDLFSPDPDSEHYQNMENLRKAYDSGLEEDSSKGDF